MELLVSARALVATCNLDSSEDADVAGVYSILLDDEVQDFGPGTLAGIALDVFHSTVAVGCLDDFEFLVIDPCTMAVLESDPEYEDYTGEGYGKDLELTGRRPLKAYAAAVFSRNKTNLGSYRVAAHNMVEAKNSLKALAGETAYSVKFN